MTHHSDNQRLLRSDVRGRAWLQRTLLTIAGALLVVIAFFFLTVALVAGALLATAIVVRVWWIARKLRAAQKKSEPLEGEYSVVEGKAMRRIEP